MSDFPYCLVNNKLKRFLEKLSAVGQPSSVTYKWLASIGFPSSNDRAFVSVLKFIGFVDQAGAPTEKWLNYRDKNRRPGVLADAIQRGYEELFQTYPDAWQRTDDDLKNFFFTRTKGGDQVVSATVGTFKALCSLADFGVVVASGESATIDSADDSSDKETRVATSLENGLVRLPKSGITVNINIQLTVPDTTDEIVYDKLFAALKKHLLT